MKPGVYLSPVTCPNEYCLAEWIIFELKEAHQRMLSDIRMRLLDMEGRYGTWASINCHWAPERIEVLNYLEDASGRIRLLPGVKPADLPTETPLYLGEEFDWESPDEDEVWRSECAGFKVYSGSLYVTALGKYTSDTVESVDINGLLFDEVRGPGKLDPEIVQAIQDGAPIKEEIGVTVASTRDIKKSRFD